MALERRKESSINIFLTLDSNFPFDQDLYQVLPELSHDPPAHHPFSRNISDLEGSVSKGLPPISIIDDSIKYSSLPTPEAGSKYDAGIYWSSTDPFAIGLADLFIPKHTHSSFFGASDSHFYPNEGAKLENTTTYVSPISPQVNKKRKSSDFNFSDSPPIASRKKTIVNACACSGKCGAQIASIFMRGPIHELEKTYVIDVLCNRCSDHQQNDAGFMSYQYIPSSRKKSRDDQKAVECDVCRTKIGRGGIRPVDFSQDVADDLTVEYVCNSCISKYQFCSECGGGGKSRTGKWRPIDLFEKGRRTCALPHVRVGDSKISFVSYSQNQMTNTIVSQLKDLFFDSYLSCYACPTFMETTNQTFQKLVQETIYPIWKNGIVRYISSPPPPDISRYILIEWVQKQHRNKAKAKAQKEEGNSRWLKVMKLNLESGGDSLSDSTYVSFGIVEWDHEKRVVFIPQIVPRSFFAKSLKAYDQVISQAIQSIVAKAFKERISMPLYMVLFGKSDNAKVKGIPERLGFLEKSEFVSANPSSERLLDELDYPILKTPNSLIHVANMEQLLAKL